MTTRIPFAILMLLISFTCFGQEGASESLNPQQLADLQKQGEKKLQDFYDYLGVLSNPAYEKDIRSDAKESAKAVFYANNCFVDGKMAKTFIDSCFDCKKRLGWKVVSVEVKQNLKLKANVLDNGYYEGVVTFKISSGTDTIANKKAYIVIEENKKQARGIKKAGWEAYVGDIL